MERILAYLVPRQQGCVRTSVTLQAIIRETGMRKSASEVSFCEDHQGPNVNDAFQGSTRVVVIGFPTPGPRNLVIDRIYGADQKQDVTEYHRREIRLSPRL